MLTFLNYECTCTAPSSILVRYTGNGEVDDSASFSEILLTFPFFSKELNNKKQCTESMSRSTVAALVWLSCSSWLTSTFEESSVHQEVRRTIWRQLWNMTSSLSWRRCFPLLMQGYLIGSMHCKFVIKHNLGYDFHFSFRSFSVYLTMYHLMMSN